MWPCLGALLLTCASSLLLTCASSDCIRL
jgi:hypothetical protein